MRTVLQSIRMLIAITLLTGITYPLALTGLAHIAFPSRAGGSLVVREAKCVGSELLAQKFRSPRYFQPRPSAADYATVASGASNKGPTSADLVTAVKERQARIGRDAPVDLLTASGSGLDPHISPEAAMFQIHRIAAARGIADDRLINLVQDATEPPQLAFLGEPRVNVLLLNLKLDSVAP